MKKVILVAGLLVVGGLLVGVALWHNGAQAADTLQSGPQVGQEVPGPFEPLNVTGPDAGDNVCLFCKNGLRPVAMIFAREASEPVTNLIKKIDAATAEHKADKMGSFVVFLGDKDMEPGLKKLAEKENIKNTILSIYEPSGPEAYKIARDADVTVVLYTRHQVKANHAFKKGELTDKETDKVLADLPKILPAP